MVFTNLMKGEKLNELQILMHIKVILIFEHFIFLDGTRSKRSITCKEITVKKERKSDNI